MCPLAHLAKLATHEQQLLSWLGKHVSKEQAQVGKSLPFVPRHFADQRALAMHHLVVRQGQHKIFRKAVQHAKRKQIVMEFAMNGIVREIRECVVHPTHIPLHAEPQPANINRPRNHRPGGGFFCDGLNISMFLVGFSIKLA